MAGKEKVKLTDQKTALAILVNDDLLAPWLCLLELGTTLLHGGLDLSFRNSGGTRARQRVSQTPRRAPPCRIGAGSVCE